MKTFKKMVRFFLSLLLLFVLPLTEAPNQKVLAAAIDTSLTRTLSNTASSPTEVFYSFTPKIGNVKALIFMVEFPDVSFDDGKQDDTETVLTTEELQQALFGDEDTNSVNYPYESVKAYYERASYNKLHFTGTVLYYKAKHNRQYYDTLRYSVDKDAARGYETLMMEATCAYKDSIDFSQYDANSDGILDAIYLSVPTNGTSDDATWWGNQSTWYVNQDFRIDNEKIVKYVILDGQPLNDNITYYNQVWIHETGHLLGLSDYYHTSLINSDDWQGFTGEAGCDMMDDMTGDHNAFSKILCGWINTNKVQIVDSSKPDSKYVLKPCEESPSVLIVPVKKWRNNFYSEYYLIEYDNGTGNNTGVSNSTGIRIWHVNAYLTNDWWNSGYKMFAFDQNITNSKRTLLTSLGEDIQYTYYQTGDIFNSKSDSNAIYYVKKGTKLTTVPINFTVKIGKLTKDGYLIRIIMG